jgi:hypothetical protein
VAGRTRGVIAVALVLGTLVGLAGCTPAGPMGLRKNGDALIVVIGRQCVPASYLTTLRLRNMDEARNESIDPPLWEIEAKEPRAVPEVQVGVVPDGYIEKANNIATQGVKKRVALSVSLGSNTYATTLDVSSIPSGKVLDANRDLLTEAEFRKRNGCG